MVMSALLPQGLLAQQESPTTGAEGVVVDVRTGEPIPFAQVVFVGTQIGAVADSNGHFQVENKKGLITLSVSFVGYKKQIVTLHANRITKNMRIELEPDGLYYMFHGDITYCDAAVKANKLSIIIEDKVAARETLDNVRTFIKNNPTVYLSTHCPEGYENLEMKRLMKL